MEDVDSPSLFKSPEGENVFDFREDLGTDLWSPNFTRTLRLGSHQFEAMPVLPDKSVETIGGAFVEEERSLKPRFVRDGSVRKRPEAVHPAGTAGYTDSPNVPSLSTVSSSSDIERIRELEKRIDELETERWQPPPIPDTINRLLLGKSCSLSWYKSVSEKKALLDASISTYDGNCIMAVLLFIKNSVDQSILLNILERRPVAVRHYANFLKKLKNWKELEALYRRLNDNDNLAYLNLQQCEARNLDKDEKLKRVKNCPVVFKRMTLQRPEDVQHVEEYSRLVNKQLKIEEAAGHGGAKIVREDGVLFTPLTTTLLYCCRMYRGQERSTGNPEELRRLFNIPEKQYFQMDLLALALNKDWRSMSTLLTTKGVLGFGKKKKSPIGFERVVRLLGQDKYKTPEKVLVTYLEEIDDLEERYQLAMEVLMYDAALECLKLLKDRERVETFINFIPPIKHYEFRKKIEQLLANSQIKWK